MQYVPTTATYFPQGSCPQAHMPEGLKPSLPT